MSEEIKISVKHLELATILYGHALVGREMRDGDFIDCGNDLRRLGLADRTDFEVPKGSFVYDLTYTGRAFVESLREQAVSIIPRFSSLPQVR